MKLSIETLSPVKRALVIEVEPSVVGREFDVAYSELGRRAKIPGFRPGKVPLPVLEKRFQREVTDDVVQRLVPRFYEQALKDAGLVPVQLPTIEGLSIAKDAPLSFRAVVEVRPEVALQPYTALPLRRRRVSVADADVSETLENIRLRQAELVSYDDGHQIAEGDFAVVDFEGSSEGQPLPGASATGYLVHVGEQSVIPEIDAALRGHRKGDHVETEVTFPAEYQSPQVAGRRVLFRVTVGDVKQRVLPALDDELAKDVGLASLDELRERVRQEITARKQAEQRAEERGAMVKLLNERHQIDLPPSLVQRETAALRDRMERHLGHAGHGPEATEAPGDAVQKEILSAAEGRVKGDLLLEAIADREGVTVGMDEIEREVQRIAAQTRSDIREVRKLLAGESGEFVGLRATIRREKTLDWLIDHADIREEDGSTTGQEPR
ncbi:MAG: trigger factor [Nitrospirota bacterium]